MKDFLDRIRTRAEEKRTLAEFPRKGICFGSLTPGAEFSIGAAIGQVTEVQPSATNLLLQSADASLAPWVLASGNMGPVVTGSFFVVNGSPVQTWSASIVLPAERKQTISSIANSVRLVASIYIGVSLQGTTIGNASGAVKLGVRFINGATPLDWNATFNPSSGAISSANTSVQVTEFVALGDRWFRVSIEADNNATGNTQAEFYVQNGLQGGAAGLYAFAPQLEALATGNAAATPTDVVVTTNAQVTRQPNGVIARGAVDRSINGKVVTAADSPYALTAADYGNLIVCQGAVTINLPAFGSGAGQLPSGFWCDVSVDPVTVGSACTLQAPALETVYYPGGPTVPTIGNAVTFPSAGLNVDAVKVNLGAVSSSSLAAPDWYVSDCAVTGTGTFGGSLAVDQIAFGSAANTITGSANLKYTAGGGLALNNLLDISGAAGGQIKFPATQNPSANANTLDDYEEGTWTPSVGGSATYLNQIGGYTKIGNVVTLTFRIEINAIGTGSVTTVSGAPFTSNTQNLQSSGGVGLWGSLLNTVASLSPAIGASTTSITFNGVTVAQASSSNPVNVFGNSARIDATLIYRTT